MSRTYRRKSIPIPKYVTTEYVYDWDNGRYRDLDKNSKEYKKSLAIYLSDAGSHSCKEPGPSWFRNLYTERPQRREAKRQLQKYLLDEEFVVILNAKNKLEYWT